MSSSSPTAWQASRAFFSGGSRRRHEKFPAHTIHNGPSVSRFDKLPADNRYASQIEAIARDTNNGQSLAEKDLVIVRLGKEEGEQGYDYWIYLFEELATKLDTPAKESQ